MIDGFKLKVTDHTTIQHLFNDPKLDFKSEVSHHTGEVSNLYKARYKGIRFEYLNAPHKQIMFIRGSLPQYYTGLSNYTNLPLAEALQGMEALAAEWQLDLTTTEVLRLEWGINVSLPEHIGVNRLIQNILVYKGKKPNQHFYDRNGMLFLIDLNDFSIKVYNKGAQHGSSGSNLLHYELQITRKPLLQRLGIYSLADLYNKQCTDKLQQKQLETINHLVFYDYHIYIAAISKRSIPLLMSYNNSSAWEKLMQDNGEVYRKKKKSFAKGVAKASGVDWNKLLKQAIEQEANKLLIVEQMQAEALQEHL